MHCRMQRINDREKYSSAVEKNLTFSDKTPVEFVLITC